MAPNSSLAIPPCRGMVQDPSHPSEVTGLQKAASTEKADCNVRSANLFSVVQPRKEFQLNKVLSALINCPPLVMNNAEQNRDNIRAREMGKTVTQTQPLTRPNNQR